MMRFHRKFEEIIPARYRRKEFKEEKKEPKIETEANKSSQTNEIIMK